MSPIRVASIGAGPVGLTLARLLLNKPNVDFVGFESEKSRDARGQGGTLDLHPATGLATLKEAGLYDDFLERARFDGEELIICDKDLTKYVELSGSDENSSHGTPEIDRISLREMLLNYHSLIFDRGIETGFDLIVGAEGAGSKTCKLVSDQMPNYSGIFGISFEIPNAKETAPECYKLTNRGSLFSYTDGRAIMPQYLGDGSIKVGVYITQPRDWAENLLLDSHDLEATKKAILDEFEGWAPELLQSVRRGQNTEFCPIYMLPVGWLWENRPGVTLIGDAAHVMTPFAGQGVNLGMQDALMLSRAIVKGANSPISKDALSNEIKSFEKALFIRAKETATLTNDLMTMFFFSGPLRTVIEQIVLRKLTFCEKSLLQRAKYPLMAAFVYGSYTMFKLWH